MESEVLVIKYLEHEVADLISKDTEGCIPIHLAALGRALSVGNISMQLQRGFVMDFGYICHVDAHDVGSSNTFQISFDGKTKRITSIRINREKKIDFAVS